MSERCLGFAVAKAELAISVETCGIYVAFFCHDDCVEGACLNHRNTVTREFSDPLWLLLIVGILVAELSVVTISECENVAGL